MNFLSFYNKNPFDNNWLLWHHKYGYALIGKHLLVCHDAVKRQETDATMARNDLTTPSDQDKHLAIAESVLQGLLPASCKLELNAKTRMLSLLSTDHPHILAQEQFTKNEWNVLLTFLSSYPYYAPYEVLLASLTSLSPAVCRKRLQEAQQAGSKTLKQELKPVHRALSGIRAKLDKLYPPLKISPIRDVGYVLTSSQNKDLWQQGLALCLLDPKANRSQFSAFKGAYPWLGRIDRRA